jgi:protein KRI1
MDVRAYKQKGQNSEKKKKLLSSLYGTNNDDELDNDQDPIENVDEPKTTKQLEKVQIKSNKTSVKPSKSVQMSSVTEIKSRQQESDTIKNEKTPKDRKTIVKPANPLSATNDNAVVKKNNKKKKKKKNKNILQSLSDKRLEAFGINPKKFKKKLKYSNNTVTDEKKLK